MDAWSLIRGDTFIHFVCGSRRVNIRLGVLLLILKSPQNTEKENSILADADQTKPQDEYKEQNEEEISTIPSVNDLLE